MVKGSNSVRNNKLHSSKPYDVSNSFVKKVTSRVTNLLPQPSWLSKWFTSSDANDCHTKDMLNSNDSSSDDDGDDDNTNEVHAPPTKRAKIPLNQPFPPNSFKVSPAITNEVLTPQPGTSRSIRNEFINDGAVAGPSGINTRQHVSSTPNIQSPGTHLLAGAERKMNGDDRSESSESTSGCSSLVPQANRQFTTGESVMNNLSARRRSMDEKLNFTGHLQSPRSLFADRSHSRSPRLNSSINNRRRPSFSVSSFVSPIQAKDRLSIKNRVVNSPFYSGKTTYGGASAYRRSKDGFFVPNETTTPKRCGVQVKPVNCASDSLSTMSTTARRILEALEQFSTPVLDAKRIPLEPSTPPLGSKRKRPCDGGFSPALRLGESPRTPNSARQLTTGLTIPTVPDLLKMRHREKLQDSMEAARLIAVSSANSLIPPSYHPKSNQEYKLRNEDDGKIARHGGKIRGKRELEDEAVEEVNLPNISLPLTSLPKFDFVVPPAANSSPVTSTFKFASPITVTENTRTCLPVDNFTFSKPLSALGNKEPISHNGRKINCVDTFIPNCPTKLGELQFKSGSDSAERGNSKSVLRKKNSENSEMCFGIKPATELKTGSVMDILGKKSNLSSKEDIISLDKFKPAQGSWECGTCMIRNKSDVDKCAACETSRVPVSQVVSNTTPNMCPDKELKKSEDTWECSSCHVHNLQSTVSCSKCSLAKSGPNSFHKKEPEHQQEKPIASSLLGFDYFKPPTNSWECSTCLVRNPDSSKQCQACETKRPALSTKSTPISVPSISTGSLGFGDKFKKPAGSWDCPDCMLQNKSDSLKCLACERTKPGTELQAASKSNNNSQDTGGFKFGIDKAGETLKDSDSSSSKLQGFKFGETKSTTASGFSFGIVSTVTKSDTSTVVTPSLNFGNSAFSTSTSNSLMKPAVTSSLTQGFTFGIPQNSQFNSPSNDKKPSKEVPKKRRQSFDEADHSKDTKISDMQGHSVSKIPGISMESHNFNNKKENEEKSETKDVTKKVSFSFGSSSGPNSFTSEKPNISTNSTECAKSTFSFGAPSTTAVSLSFSSLKPIVTTASFGFATSNATSGSSFGNSAPNNTSSLTATTTTIATTTSVMVVSTAAPSTTTVANVKTVPAASTVTSNLFTFGSSKPPISFGTSSSPFGQPSASNTSTTFGTTASTTSASSNFIFKAPQEKPFGGSTKESNANSSTRNQIPSFGSVTSSANVTALGPLATTTAASSVTPSLPTFGSSTTIPSFSLGSRGTIPAFGAPNTTSAITTAAVSPSFGSGPTPNFGTGFSTLNDHKPGLSTMNKPTTSIAPFTFGSGTNPSTSSLGQTAPFAFGNNQNNQVLGNKNTFGFGTATSNATLGSSTSATPGFGFGAQVQSFSFGPGAVTTSTPVIQPLFGSTASTAPSSASSSLFGTGATNTSLFGASNSSGGTSTTTTTGTVVVATVAPTTNPVFSAPTLAFGSSNTQPPSNVFGFSGGQASGSTNVPVPTFASPSNFNFNPVQSPAQPPTFNPNMRPSFNFTGGETPSFTAPAVPAPPVAAPMRRIKKAVRRTGHPRPN